jgi:hypothetical protein
MNPRLVLVPLLLSALVVCRPDSPEGQVKRAFEACVKAVDSGDAAPAVELLAKDFSGPEGMGREDAKLFLLGVLSREKVGITVLSSRIEFQGSQAQQSTELLLTSRSGSGLLPQEASRHLYLLRWERQKGQWKLRELQESK